MKMLKAEALYMDWDQFDAQRLFVIGVLLLNLSGHPVFQVIASVGALAVLYNLGRAYD